MSLILITSPASEALDPYAGAYADVAADPFQIGPVVVLGLVLLAVVLLTAIGRVIAIVWAVLREALPLLGVLLLGLALVALLGLAAVSGGSVGTPPGPIATTTARPAPPLPRPTSDPRSTAGRGTPRPSGRPASPGRSARRGTPAPAPLSTLARTDPEPR